MNTLKILSLATLCLSVPNLSLAQINIAPSTNVNILPGTTVNLAQDLLLQNTSTVTISGQLQIKGDFINNGTLTTTGGSSILFDGMATQSISGSNPISVSSLAVDNVTGVTLSLPVRIIDSLLLVNGNLNTDSANPVIFANTARDPLESNTSYISGRAIMEDRVVGIGVLDTFLGVYLSAGDDLGNLSVIRTTGTDGIVTAGTNTSIACNWMITTSNIPATQNRTATFGWLSALDNGNDALAMNLYGSHPPFIYSWTEKLNVSSQDVSGGDLRYFVQTGIDNFNRRFTLADSTQPLPIELIDLTAKKNEGNALLHWVAEMGSTSGFNVERSTDAKNFEQIAYVKALGKMDTGYDFTDSTIAAFPAGDIFYRIKLVKFDNSFVYSNVRRLTLEENGFNVNVYPNPFVETLYIDITKDDEEPVTVRIIDMSGKVLLSTKQAASRKARLTLRSIDQVAAGTYVIQVSNTNNIKSVRVTKSK